MAVHTVESKQYHAIQGVVVIATINSVARLLLRCVNIL